MSAEAGFVRSWRVGKFTATLSSPMPKRGQARGAVIEWAPTEPRGLSAAEVKEYRAGRDGALAELAQALGVRVAVLEL